MRAVMRFVPTVLLGLALMAPAAAQLGGEGTDWLVVVVDGPCLGGVPHCFQIPEGTRDAAPAGASASITVRNDGNSTHRYYVAALEDSDRGRSDSKPTAALAELTVAPGGEGVMEFTIPKVTKGIYFWCDEPGHELDNDWLVFDVAPLPEKDSPSVAVPLALAAFAIAAVTWRRR